MSSLFLTIGWIVWACAAFIAITFIFWSRRQARAERTFTWPTAIWALFLWVLVITFLFNPSWNKLHLSWLLPTTFLSSITLFFVGIPIITPVVIFLTNIFMQSITVGVGTPKRKPIVAWTKFAKNELGRDAIKGFDKIVLDFLVPDNINPTKFHANLVVLSRGGLPVIDEDPVINPTPSLEKFYNPVARPLGFPNWFIIAYPDVASWVREQGNMQSFFRKIFGKVTEDQLLDEEQYLKCEYLRGLVDAYREGIADRLECGI